MRKRIGAGHAFGLGLRPYQLNGQPPVGLGRTSRTTAAEENAAAEKKSKVVPIPAIVDLIYSNVVVKQRNEESK